MSLWLLSLALAGTHEAYGGFRFDGHQSLTHVGLGLGGQAGYRYRTGKVTVGGAQLWGDWAGRFAVVSEAEVGVSPWARPEQAARWAMRPWVGLEGVLWFTPYRVARADVPDPGWAVFSPRLALRPLVFESGGGLTLSALEVSLGVGAEAPGRSVSGGLNLVVVGARWN